MDFSTITKTVFLFSDLLQAERVVTVAFGVECSSKEPSERMGERRKEKGAHFLKGKHLCIRMLGRRE